MWPKLLEPLPRPPLLSSRDLVGVSAHRGSGRLIVQVRFTVGPLETGSTFSAVHCFKLRPQFLFYQCCWRCQCKFPLPRLANPLY